jgi:ketosteroid isomerase-like protein
MEAEMSPEELVRQHFDALATGSLDAARSCIHPGNVNHMAADEPPACAQPGPAGFLATSAWLRMAFSPLTFEVIELAGDAERTITHVWMRGRQTGPFVVFPHGSKPVAFPPTGREFAVRHCHVFRLRDGLHGEHIAVRDDLGMMTQLGHLPPSPAVAARMARWAVSGRSRRAIAQAVAVSAAAAAGSESLTSGAAA